MGRVVGVGKKRFNTFAYVHRRSIRRRAEKSERGGLDVEKVGKKGEWQIGNDEVAAQSCD